MGREEGARLLRCRWYGTNEGLDSMPEKEIYMERKVHHDGWVSTMSSKDRFILPQNRVAEFLNGNLDVDDPELANTSFASKRSRELADEVSQLQREKRMRPLIRTSYYRSAYQLAHTNEDLFIFFTAIGGAAISECK